MYFPLVREWVRVEGRDGLFRVVRADYKRGLADLVSQESSENLIGIPFALLMPKSRDPK